MLPVVRRARRQAVPTRHEHRVHRVAAHLAGRALLASALLYSTYFTVTRTQLEKIRVLYSVHYCLFRATRWLGVRSALHCTCTK